MKTWGDFENIVIVDYEFRGGDGNTQNPICYVALDVNSGATISHWITEKDTAPSYPIDDKTLFIAYYASAELGCHYSLNFKIPPYVLDLFAEFRCLTNGGRIPSGNSLLGACSYYGITNTDATYKNTMRNLILQQRYYTEAEKRDILEYCRKDVELTATLFDRMKPCVDLPYALLRGRYMAAVAAMEYNGIPIDTGKLTELRDLWGILKEELIWRVDQQYHVFEGTTFKIDKFKEYLAEHQIPWDYTPTGLPKTDESYMQMQAKVHPQLKPLQELRHALSQLKLNDLQVGTDGRNRCLLSPYRSITGRNQPSTSRFIFGNATWLRFLIRPPPGTALAYIDYEQQEIAIAAALSCDKNLLHDYNTGDPYLAFAKAAKAIPPEGTKETHPETRETFKRCMLAINYGMSTETFADYAQITIPQAKLMIRWHKQRYQRYWEWNSQFIDIGILSGLVGTRFNWYFQTARAKYRTLMNWPMQAHGANILQLAVPLCVDNGIKVIAPVHDAILIEAPIKDIENKAAQAQYYLRLASKWVINFEIATDVKIIRYPDHYTDPRGELMWNSVWDIINNMEPAERKARLLEAAQTEMATHNLRDAKHKALSTMVSKKRQHQLLLQAASSSEKQMVQRIRKQSGLSHVEVMHLIRQARDTDFDLEHEVDWDQGYTAAKDTIDKGIDPLRKKTLRELSGEQQ
ncbi:MAG: DNA polymerase I [Candidatus Thermoplasmatota archaeon]|nr:DNA polymerase I [Candidatus Thermoplasmatota archaeon]